MMRRIRDGALVVFAPLFAVALAAVPAARAAQPERAPLDREAAWEESSSMPDTAVVDARRTQEKSVRGAYLKLMRYQRAYVEQTAVSPAAASTRPAEELRIELGRIQTGGIGEILNRPLGELATAGTGRLLRAQPIVYQLREGPDHLAYRTELFDAQEPAEWKGWDDRTVADQLRRMGPEAERAEIYTAYEVTLTLGGERRSYRAFAVYTSSGPDEAIAVVDNVVGARTVSDLLTAEFPPVRAPWVRYVRSPTYATVARRIEEARRAGRSPIPAGAPAGALAGDGVVPDLAARRGSRRATKTQPVVCVPITVGQLRVEYPKTGAPTQTDAIIDANAAVAFAADTTPDLVVLFQGDTPMTVTAMNVEPATGEAMLRWKLQRDPTDTVAADLPLLDATAGPQVKVTPKTAGNFRLICYVDTSHNNDYDAGEELRVLRFAIVRGTLTNANFCTIGTAGLGFITLPDAPAGEIGLAPDPAIDPAGMDVSCKITLEGGGAQRKIGTGAVQLGDVGNLRATSAQVVYAPAPGASAPLGFETLAADLPMLDGRADGTGGETAFRSRTVVSQPAPGPGGNGISRIVGADDPPGAGPWKVQHPTAHTTWATTRGGYNFRDFIAAFTSSFQSYYVVFASGDWAVRVVGQNTSGTWHDTGSTVTVQNQSAPTSPMTNAVTGTTPKPADAAGMQPFGKNYANRANRPFQYTLTNLAAPTLSGTSGNALATLTWNAPAGAKTYNLRRGTTSGGPYQDVALGLKTTAFTNTGLTNGTQYFFVVTAADGALESPNSNQVSVTPTSGATQPPTAPKNLVATRGTGQITLTWGSVAGADTYRIKRSLTNGGPYTAIVDGVIGTTYTNTNLTKGTTYYYVVSAVNSAGESPNSTQASATP
jgi:hypothetical protein